MPLFFTLLACIDSSALPGTESEKAATFDFDLESTDAPTVFRVTAETVDAAEVRVEYGLDGAFDHTVPCTTEDGLVHEALLAGLGAGETWELRAVASTDAGEEQSATVELELDDAPDRLQVAALTDAIPERGGFFLVTLPYPNDNYVALYDREGRPTWWYNYTSEGTTLDAHMTPDGEAVDLLTTIDGSHVSTFLRVGLDGQVQLLADAAGAHHAFVSQPDGGYIALSYDYIAEADAYGDAMRVLDDDFNLVYQPWTTTDAFTVPPDLPETDDGFDWTHANSITVDESGTQALVSLYNLDTVVMVDLTTGDTEWRLGGGLSDWLLPQDATLDGQHMAHFVDGGILVFNNGSPQSDGLTVARSEILQYSIGEEVEVVRRWTEEDEIYVANLGNADPDAEGWLTVGWGVTGRLTEMNADWEKVFQMDMSLGSPFGYVHRVETLAGASH